MASNGFTWGPSPAQATTPSRCPPARSVVSLTARPRPSAVDRSAITSASRTSVPTTFRPLRSKRSRTAAPMPDADPLMAIVRRRRSGTGGGMARAGPAGRSALGSVSGVVTPGVVADGGGECRLRSAAAVATQRGGGVGPLRRAPHEEARAAHELVRSAGEDLASDDLVDHDDGWVG